MNLLGFLIMDKTSYPVYIKWKLLPKRMTCFHFICNTMRVKTSQQIFNNTMILLLKRKLNTVSLLVININLFQLLFHKDKPKSLQNILKHYINSDLFIKQKWRNSTKTLLTIKLLMLFNLTVKLNSMVFMVNLVQLLTNNLQK